jgi:hypothetical protein
MHQLTEKTTAIQSGIKKLQSYLAPCSNGELPFGKTRDIERLLFECWHEFVIESEDAGMEAYKLLNRTEDMTWASPMLTFSIERHGATVGGSVYAHIYQWAIDVERGTASMDRFPTRRQVGDLDKPLKVKPLAQEIADLILNGKEDSRLAWKNETKVRLLITKIIPTTNEQTTSGRRKRFRSALAEALQPHGWRMSTINTFERLDHDNTSPSKGGRCE